MLFMSLPLATLDELVIQSEINRIGKQSRARTSLKSTASRRVLGYQLPFPANVNPPYLGNNLEGSQPPGAAYSS
jgi:hypothetical protein